MSTLHLQADGTLTTTTPAGAATTRPVPPSWASVAPLLERWLLNIRPRPDGFWDVARLEIPQAGVFHVLARSVAFAALPQAIADVAARCEEEAQRA